MSEDTDLRAIAKTIFARDPRTELSATPPNHVPREGNTATPPSNSDLRNFVREVFGLDPA